VVFFYFIPDTTQEKLFLMWINLMYFCVTSVYITKLFSADDVNKIRYIVAFATSSVSVKTLPRHIKRRNTHVLMYVQERKFIKYKAV
jgi:hypothetical protein